MTPLHFMCANECVTPDLLTEFFFFDRQNNTCSLVDRVSALSCTFMLCISTNWLFYLLQFGAAPLHMLCMNESITSAHVGAMLHMCSDASFSQDQVR